MENLVKIAPLALLILGASVAIWRGLRRKPHDKGNTSAGGPGDGGVAD